ncbi:MAG TPA: hypothetical protein VFI33_12340 [Puia sp.]|nr:hypothetical protein [Puia sp.]
MDKGGIRIEIGDNVILGKNAIQIIYVNNPPPLDKGTEIKSEKRISLKAIGEFFLVLVPFIKVILELFSKHKSQN